MTSDGGHVDGANAGVAPVVAFPWKPFDPDGPCPKCGLNNGHRVVWHKEIELTTKTHADHVDAHCRAITEGYCIPSDKKDYVWVPEHMHRHCGVCQYQWAEAPLT